MRLTMVATGRICIRHASATFGNGSGARAGCAGCFVFEKSTRGTGKGSWKVYKRELLENVCWWREGPYRVQSASLFVLASRSVTLCVRTSTMLRLTWDEALVPAQGREVVCGTAALAQSVKKDAAGIAFHKKCLASVGHAGAASQSRCLLHMLVC